MKNVKTIAAITLLTLSLSMFSCKDKIQGNTEKEVVITEDIAKEGKEYTSAYVCPMHCEGKEYTSAYVCPMHCEGSGSDEEGSCPKCGMTYVKNADHTANGHMHK